MKKLAAGAVIWTAGAVSASAAPLGLQMMSATDSDASLLTIGNAFGTAVAHPMWGLLIFGFGLMGGSLRRMRKERAALAYA